MKLRIITLALALPILAFLGSCGTEEAPKPTISLLADGINANQDVIVGTAIKFSVKATAGSAAMKNIVITATIAGKSQTIVDSALTTKDIAFVRNLKAVGSPGDEVKYTFTANDANGESASTSVTLNVLPIQGSLDGQSGFQVYNAASAGMYTAFDLALAQPLLPGGALTNKDILDATLSSAQQWSKTWKSGNGSTFVKVTSNDWNNASSTTYLFNLWKANKTKMTETISVVNGDVILVRSGQALDFNLFIVKITNVVDLPAIGNNNDYAQFDYRGVIK